MPVLLSHLYSRSNLTFKELLLGPQVVGEVSVKSKWCEVLNSIQFIIISAQQTEPQRGLNKFPAMIGKKCFPPFIMVQLEQWRERLKVSELYTIFFHV